MYRETNKEQVFWHIAEYQAQHVASLLVRGFNLYLKGDLGGWYWTFVAIRDRIHQDLSYDDRIIMNAMEKRINRFHPSWNRYKKLHDDGLKISKGTTKRKNIFCGLTREYVRKIMDLLKDTGYLPRKEDRTRMGF